MLQISKVYRWTNDQCMEMKLFQFQISNSMGDVLQRQTKFHKDEATDPASKVTLCSSDIPGTIIFLIRSLSYVP